MTDFSKTNIHCSSIGIIMTGERGKSPEQKWKDCVSKYNEAQVKYDLMEDDAKGKSVGKKQLERVETLKGQMETAEHNFYNNPLSVTAKSHLKTVYGYAKYGKWAACKDKGNKYVNKGKIAEQDSIDLICRLRGIQFTKNEERVSNEFLTGIPDVFLGEEIMKAEYVIDVKTPWDIETFLSNLGKPLHPAYWWQIQGYMAITGAKIGEVAYCLVNTPASILNREKYALKERLDVVTDEDPTYIFEEQRLIKNMTFDDIDYKDRVIRFLVERDDEAIERVYKKVQRCREYLSEIEELHSQGVFLAKEAVEMEDAEELAA